MKETLISVSEAAERLNISRSRVHALIDAERLPAKPLGNKVNSPLMIEERHLKLVAIRKNGRPKQKTRKQ